MTTSINNFSNMTNMSGSSKLYEAMEPLPVFGSSRGEFAAQLYDFFGGSSNIITPRNYYMNEQEVEEEVMIPRSSNPSSSYMNNTRPSLNTFALGITDYSHDLSTFVDSMPTKIEGGEYPLRKQMADERRKMKNRERVRRCRKRKQDLISTMETQNVVLEEENAMLTLKLAKLSNLEEEISASAKDVIEKKQIAVLSEMIAFFEQGSQSSKVMADRVSTVFTENARLVQPLGKATVIQGLPNIAAHQGTLHPLLDVVRVTNYSVNHNRKESVQKCNVHWSMEVKLSTAAFTLAPLQVVAAMKGRTLLVSGTSYITFEHGKILEDIRVLDVPAFVKKLSTIIEDPTVLVQVLTILV